MMNRKRNITIRRCCVSHCETESYSVHESKNRLFHFVEWSNNQMSCPVKELARRRFWRWINVLGQDPQNTRNTWVCYNHFYSGRPATLLDVYNPDWLPTQNLAIASTENNIPNDANRNVNEQPLNEIIPSPYGGSSANVDHSERKVIEPRPKLQFEGMFCRLCFLRNQNLHPLFPTQNTKDNNLPKIIKALTGIQFQHHVDCNSLICLECERRLEEFHKHRKIWIKHDKQLKSFREKTCGVKYPIPLVTVPLENLIEDVRTLHAHEIPSQAYEDTTYSEVKFSEENVTNETKFDYQFSDGSIEIVHKTRAHTYEDTTYNKDKYSEENAPNETMFNEQFSEGGIEMVHETSSQANQDTTNYGDRGSDENVPHETKNDDKFSEELYTDPSHQNNTSQVLSNVEDETIVISDSSDSKEKDELIKRVMRKIRRKTFFPNKRKSMEVVKSRKRSRK